jgi:hypothetical protein
MMRILEDYQAYTPPHGWPTWLWPWLHRYPSLRRAKTVQANPAMIDAPTQTGTPQASS